MDIQQVLFKFKNYIIGALIALLAISIFSYLLTMFISFILYIYPLLICTSLLVVTTVFTNTTTPNNDRVPIPRPAAEIIDYVVAGNNLHLHQHHNHHLDNNDNPELHPLENDDEVPPKSMMTILAPLNFLHFPYYSSLKILTLIIC
jgi:ABC-type transport system involved in cytochrome bd biosynthesis fused ATPase/permease subunit